MFISSLAYEPGFPPEWEGLDYQSAEDATPRLYGVSSGNGNDGVSHTFTDYYCRTSDPWTLARAALIGNFKPKAQEAVSEAMEVDGEKEYTISATLLDPLDDESDEGDGSWSDANGAYMIVEVFPVEEDDMREGRMVYDNLEDCFGADSLELRLALKD